MPAWQTDGNPDAHIGANSFLGTLADDPLRIRTRANVNNADAMTITPAPDATTTGNVGIGTTNPERWRLAIQGGELISVKDATGATKWHINDWNGSALGSGDLNVAETGVADGRLYLRAGGNVGIRTTNPITALHIPERGLQVGFSNTASDNFHITSDTVGGARGLRFWNGNFGAGGHILTALPNGNVGIGTAVPEARLHVIGDVQVTGDIRLSNADCAEDFDVAGIEEIEPGTVVVIDEEGAVNRSTQAYDKRVAGVISGAGDYKSGIILDNQAARKDRIPVALMGKVYCKVDARPSPIGVGDLLTTSSTPGYAMKVDDPIRASGATIGKALQALAGGQDLLPILVSLQ
jgi:hypothetical protein